MRQELERKVLESLIDCLIREFPRQYEGNEHEEAAEIESIAERVCTEVLGHLRPSGAQTESVKGLVNGQIYVLLQILKALNVLDLEELQHGNLAASNLMSYGVLMSCLQYLKHGHSPFAWDEQDNKKYRANLESLYHAECKRVELEGGCEQAEPIRKAVGTLALIKGKRAIDNKPVYLLTKRTKELIPPSFAFAWVLPGGRWKFQDYAESSPVRAKRDILESISYIPPIDSLYRSIRRKLAEELKLHPDTHYEEISLLYKGHDKEPFVAHTVSRTEGQFTEYLLFVFTLKLLGPLPPDCPTEYRWFSADAIMQRITPDTTGEMMADALRQIPERLGKDFLETKVPYSTDIPIPLDQVADPLGQRIPVLGNIVLDFKTRTLCDQRDNTITLNVMPRSRSGRIKFVIITRLLHSSSPLSAHDLLTAVHTQVEDPEFKITLQDIHKAVYELNKHSNAKYRKKIIGGGRHKPYYLSKWS